MVPPTAHQGRLHRRTGARDPLPASGLNLTVGPAAYAAPEQLMGSEIDERAKEYALAAKAFHPLTAA
jgi:serine/threonine protein kinase, bacterial